MPGVQGAKQVLAEPVPAVEKPEGHTHCRLAPEPRGKKLAPQVQELQETERERGRSEGGAGGREGGRVGG